MALSGALQASGRAAQVFFDGCYTSHLRVTAEKETKLEQFPKCTLKTIVSYSSRQTIR
jgi:hypothetical protein